MQPINIEQKETDTGIPLLTVQGEIDLHTAPELRSTLNALLDAGNNTLIVEMAEVPYLDSAALGVLVEAVRRAREHGGVIYLVGMVPFVRRAFDITRLVRIFEIRETTEEALKSVSSAAHAPV